MNDEFRKVCVALAGIDNNNVLRSLICLLVMIK